MTEQATEETTEDSELEDQIQDDELEETEELEDWQKEESEDLETSDQEDYKVDGKLHQSMKEKLKGRVSKRDDEIERLKAENEALKKTDEKETVLKRPIKDDFDTDEEYGVAFDKYNDDKLEDAYKRNRLKDQQDEASRKAQANLTEAIDGHYERAAELIEKSGIKPEVYQAADATVRKAVESITPNLGDLIVDQVISILGEGSEKVIYYLGRNKAALNKFQSLLASDKSGMKAAVYLGQEKQRLTNPLKPRSKAPDPASGIKGDESVTGAEGKFKKKYTAAHAKHDTQGAYNAKKEAKAAGVDVSKW